jgi:hypothetical protein
MELLSEQEYRVKITSLRFFSTPLIFYPAQ